LAKCLEIDGENGKKLQNYVEKVDLGLTCMKFAVVMETSKFEGNTIKISEFPCNR